MPPLRPAGCKKKPAFSWLFPTFRSVLKKRFHLDSLCPTSAAKVGADMNENMNTNEVGQMEFSLQAKSQRRARLARRQRRQRAQWWFAQMRRVVDAAIDWRPAPPARPAQAYMELTPKRG